MKTNTFSSTVRIVLTDPILLGVAAIFVALVIAIVTGTPHPLPVAPTVKPIAPPASTAIGWQNVILWGLTALLYFGIVRSLWTGEARSRWHFFRKISLASVLLTVPVMGIVVTAAVWLNRFPLLNRSWMYHLSSKSGNLNTYSLSTPIIGLFLFALLVLGMPSIVHGEEDLFRNGTKSWWDAIWRSLLFGLIHCLVGVSIGVGLALSLGGLWFTFHYFRGGVERSTVYHLSWNLLILFVVALTLLTP